MDNFLQWFKNHGALMDASAMGITEFSSSEGGRGAMALKDIPEGHILFKIPRDLTLSTRTSSLPQRYGFDAWRKAHLHEGWVGLILCMMWERANSTSSKWAGYLDILPDRFDTPMFWNEEDLAELEGTSVVEKLGKTEAEADYNDKLLPAVKSRPDLFRPDDIPVYYSLDMYHIIGSCILSRSFVVEKWKDEGNDEEYETAKNLPDTSFGSSMDVDSMEHEQSDKTISDQEVAEEEEVEEEEDSSDVAMVPMADMLNARYQTENAKLFYEKDELRMISTKPIKAGEQIWNTYGDLPNAELLRRYGYVDLLPLPSDGIGSPGDVVEIRADIVSSVISMHALCTARDQIEGRISWWLEEGGDDVFVIERDYGVPPAMISFAKLLLLSYGEWEKVKEKSKPPKPKFEHSLFDIILSALRSRLSQYSTSLKDDIDTLSRTISLNKRHALIVRIGEKEILHGSIERLEGLKRTESNESKGAPNKRKDDAGRSKASNKKARR